MRHTTWAAAALLAMTALAARAESVVWYNVFAQQGIDGPSQNIESGGFTPGFFTTEGPVSVTSGVASASFSAVADPVTGMFKSLAQVSIGAGTPASTAVSQGYLAMQDTLRFSGPDAFAHVTFTLNWDTRVAGWDNARIPLGETGSTGTQEFRSTQYLTLVDANPAPPAGDGGCELSEHVVCADTLPPPPRPVNSLTGLTFMDAYGAGPLYGVGDGRWTGQKTVVFDVPVGQDFVLNYSAGTSAVCVYLSGCDLTVDASHSDYIGMSLDAGVSFTSASGYRYLGLAGATAPVPEPATWLLAFIGMAAVAARARRREA